MYITNRPDLVFGRGEGAWLYDHQGKRYLGFIQGWAVNCLGHCRRRSRDALVKQAARCSTQPGLLQRPDGRAFAGLLTANSVFDRVFANTGAEAEKQGAIKLAASGARWTKGAAPSRSSPSITPSAHPGHHVGLSKPGWDTLYAQVPGFPKGAPQRHRLGRGADLDKTVGVLEPVQGEGSVIPADQRGFVQALRKLTRRHNVLLIVDEVQAGMGRTGTLFAYEHSGSSPTSHDPRQRGIGGGVPLAALLAREAVCCFQAGDQGGTTTATR